MSNLLLILCRALVPKKTSFFKVTNGIIYICLLTVKIHLRTVSTSFIVCGKPFCEVLHNSINNFLHYKETRGWGRYNIYKTSGNSTLKYHKWMNYGRKWNLTKIWYLLLNTFPADNKYICSHQKLYFSEVGVGIYSQVLQTVCSYHT